MISLLRAVVAQLDRASAFEAESSPVKRRLFALCHESCHDKLEEDRLTREFTALRRRLIWRMRRKQLIGV